MRRNDIISPAFRPKIAEQALISVLVFRSSLLPSRPATSSTLGGSQAPVRPPPAQRTELVPLPIMPSEPGNQAGPRLVEDPQQVKDRDIGVSIDNMDLGHLHVSPNFHQYHLTCS